MAECEFCEQPRARKACPYCKGKFCSTECIEAHYAGVPSCGAINEVPAHVIADARKSLGFEDEDDACEYCHGTGTAITSRANGDEFTTRCCCPLGEAKLREVTK